MITAAFEKFISQFADAESTVNVRLAEAIGEIAERQKTLHPFVLWQALQAPNDGWVDGKELTQEAS